MRLLKPPKDRREHPRIKVQMPGRYMLADRREYPCTIIDVSAGGLALKGPKNGALGERVIIYADKLGRIMGNIARRYEGGFAVELDMTGIFGRRFADRLLDLDASKSLNARFRFWQR